MRPAEDIEKLVKRLNFKASADLHERTINDALQAQAKSKKTKSSLIGPNIWRTIMKSQKAKLATAAMIILAVVLSITILKNSTSTAWAIEDTAEALDQFNAIYISGTAAPSLKALEEGFDTEIVNAMAEVLKGGPIAVEFWAQANEQRTRSGNIRIQTLNGLVGLADDTQTYLYDPNSNTVYIQQGCHIMIDPWLSGDFLLKIKEFAEDWQVTYGKDSATGKDLAFITCTVPSLSESMWIEIDLETDLPIRCKTWHNTNREGIPAYDIQRIVFLEELPDELFEFEIPADAKVFKHGFE